MKIFGINSDVIDCHRHQIKYLQSALDAAHGQIRTLEDWNATLRAENSELRNIIYKKFGLVSDDLGSQMTSTQTGSKQVTPPSWRQVKHNLEVAHKKSEQPAILASQQEYWNNKLAEQERLEAEAEKNAKISGEEAQG